MNEDIYINALVMELSNTIEKYNEKIDLAHITSILIGIIHTIGEDSGYSRRDWNHILWDLIKKNYRILK
jgi:hypothetical protein